MKPRLRWSRLGKCWLCSLPGGRRGQPLGAGLTPAEAYEDWLRELSR